PRSRRLPTPVLLVAGIAFAAALLVGTGPAAVALAVPLAIGATALGVAELLALARRPSLDRVAIALAVGWLAAATTVACFALTEPGAPLTPEYLRWPTPAHFL